MNERWWELDGGKCDNHRVCFDGEWHGWENVKPRDLRAISTALLSGATSYHHYSIAALGSRTART